jgi:hypothetical protein
MNSSSSELTGCNGFALVTNEDKDNEQRAAQ